MDHVSPGLTFGAVYLTSHAVEHLFAAAAGDSFSVGVAYQHWHPTSSQGHVAGTQNDAHALETGLF